MSSRPRIAFYHLIFAVALAACQPQSLPAPVVEASTAAPTTALVVLPSETVVPPTEAFQGVIPMSLPASRLDQGGDVDSSPFADRKAAPGGDKFVNGLYERPFNTRTMDKYFPYLDIVEVQGFRDDTWGYATISLANTDPGGALPGQYGVELDLDRDGRGDWLIRASNPSGVDWTTRGLQAWNDADGDVGGSAAMSADKSPGTGYEALVFDEGKGDVVDGAWARIRSEDPKTIEIAFKLSMIGDPSSYAMGAWAATDLDPARFDHNDFMTHAEAGSPLYGYAVYPLKGLAEIDNTCRLAIGFDPTGMEPGLCFTAAKKDTSELGCVPPPCNSAGAQCPNPCGP